MELGSPLNAGLRLAAIACVRTGVRSSILLLATVAACNQPRHASFAVVERCPSPVGELAVEPVPAGSLSPLEGLAIQAIELAGVPAEKRAAIEDQLELRVGDSFALARVRGTLARLNGLGIASSLSLAAHEVTDGVALRFELAPQAILRGVTFVGTRGPELGELAAMTGAFDDPVRVERLRRHAVERWQRAGYRDATIDVVRSRNDAGDTLCIAATRGVRYTIDRIEVVGPQVMPHAEVIRRLARRDRSVNAVGGIYDPALMAEALDELELAYADRGYPMRLPASAIEVVRTNGHELLRLTLAPSRRYRYGAITIPWPEVVPRAGKLGIAQGQPYSAIAVEQLREELRLWGDARGLVVRTDLDWHDTQVALTFSGAPDAP